MSITLVRSRWAAVGAAVAVTLGAGGIGISHATISSGEMPVFVPLDSPCRLASTRPAPNTVGPRTTGIGPDESYTLDGWGTEGDCTLPSNTTALALNVTAVNASRQTNLRFFPADAAVPATANLNPTPGAPPIPNAVDVNLNGTGQFKVFNKFGTVEVVIDVMGYYEDHVHTGDDIVDNSVSNVDTSNEPGIASDYQDSLVSLTSTPGTVTSTSIRVPSDGYVVMEVSGLWNANSAGTDTAWCQLQKGATGGVDTSDPWMILTDRNQNATGYQTFSAHRVVPISVADNPLPFEFGQSISLVCEEVQGAVVIGGRHISATFFATNYRSPGFIVIPLDNPDGAAGASD